MLAKGIVTTLTPVRRTFGWATTQGLSVTLWDGHRYHRLTFWDQLHLLSGLRVGSIHQFDYLHDGQQIIRLRSASPVEGPGVGIQPPPTPHTTPVSDASSLVSSQDLYPASIGYHHAYPGGLGQHARGTYEKALQLLDKPQTFQLTPQEASYYETSHIIITPDTPIDRTLLKWGSLLHDIGKTVEYTPSGEYQPGNPHPATGQPLVREHLRDYPQVESVTNIVASHHLPEHGGLDIRRTPEAFIVSLADNLDAKESTPPSYQPIPSDIPTEIPKIVERSVSNQIGDPDIARARSRRARY